MTKDITDDNASQPTLPEKVSTIPENLLTLSEAAVILQVSAKTVDRWTKDGRIQVYLLPSGHRRYRRIDLDGLVTVVPATRGPKIPMTNADKN